MSRITVDGRAALRALNAQIVRIQELEARVRELEAEVAHVDGLLKNANDALERPSRREVATETELTQLRERVAEALTEARSHRYTPSLHSALEALRGE